MAILKAANNAETELAESIDSGIASFLVMDASIFPSPPFVVTIDDEIMLVTNVTAGGVLEVQRGYESTIAASHQVGSTVGNRWTAGTYDELVDAIEENVSDISALESSVTGIQSDLQDIDSIIQSSTEPLNADVGTLWLDTSEDNYQGTVFDDLAGVNRTTETVKGNADNLAAHLAETASKHITESGSNANGRYIKFDDGTMICYQALKINYSDASRLLSAWTFPASFSSIPIIIFELSNRNPFNVADTQISGNITYTILDSYSASMVYLTVIGSNLASGDYVWCHATAIGRWK